jgi:hypothetical protein
VANRYINCLTMDGQPHVVDLSEARTSDEWPELVYFRRVFKVLDRIPSDRDLTFYLTNDVQRLPSYGDDVVAIVVGDDHCRIPLYLHKVAAVFKNCGSRPRLGCHPLREPSLVNLLSLLVFARRCVKYVPGLAYYVRGVLSSGRRQFAPLCEIPLGTANQEIVPLRRFSTRATTLYFAGSVTHAFLPSRVKAIKDILSPKRAARVAMLRNLNAISDRHPSLSVEVAVAAGYDEAIHSDGGSYSEELMDARIALVPRGACPQTFRFFQAMRAGCIVVTDVVPSQRFFVGAPAVRLKSWNELEAAVQSLLADPELLEQRHRHALDWWSRYCSEEAVGQYIAGVLAGS